MTHAYLKDGKVKNQFKSHILKIHFKRLSWFELQKGEITQTQRYTYTQWERERERVKKLSSYQLVHPLYGHTARPKPEAWNSIQVTHMSGRDPNSWNFAAFPDALQRVAARPWSWFGMSASQVMDKSTMFHISHIILKILLSWCSPSHNDHGNPMRWASSLSFHKTTMTTTTKIEAQTSYISHIGHAATDLCLVYL